MLRPLAVLAVLVLSFASLPPAQALLPAPVSCPAQDFIPGTQLVAAAGGEWVKATFTVTSTITDTFWGEVASPFATTAPFGYGFFADRSLVGAFIEDASGNILSTLGLALYPYGIELSLADTVLRVAAGDMGGCGSAAAGTGLTLAPGTYSIVVLAAGDTNSGSGAVLPLGVSVVNVQRGPITLLRESAYDCTVNVRATALGFASEVLQGCTKTVSASGKAYRTLFMSHFPDPLHQASWSTPNGNQNIVFFDIAKGPPGTYTLNIPTYITLLGQPFFIPGPGAPGSESGIYGAFADIA